MTLLSVLVAVGASDTITKGHLDSLDNQTLAVQEFEVIWCLDKAAEDTAAYLAAVAPHRPNVSVATVGPAEALTSCRGDYVLVLTPDVRLLPWGLQTLTQFASVHELDTVAGRTSVPGAPVPELLLADLVPVAPAEALALALADGHAVVATRRSLAEVEGGVLKPAGRCGVATESVAVRRQTDLVPVPAVDCDQVTWDRGVLSVECRVSTGETAIVAVAEHRSSGRQVVLPLPIGTSDDPGQPTRTVVRLDPRAAPDDRPLDSGPWRLLLQTADATGTQDLHPIGWRPCPSALLGEDIVIPVRVDGSLGLDVGASTRALVLTDRAELGSIRESSAGSQLHLSLPDIHTFETTGLAGQIGFGDIRVPARLVPAEPGLRLEAMATGIQGVVPITTRFGPTWFRGSGLSLEIDDVGAMRVVRTAATNSPKAPAKPPSAPLATPVTAGKRPRKKRARRGKVAALRRRVPGPLEPLARAAARRPALRRLYRKLTR